MAGDAQPSLLFRAARGRRALNRVREIPVTPSRMIHFFDPSNEKMLARVPDMARSADVLLGNLEDAIAADRKEAARAGLVARGRDDRPRRHAAVDARERAGVAVGARRPGDIGHRDRVACSTS